VCLHLTLELTPIVVVSGVGHLVPEVSDRNSDEGVGSPESCVTRTCVSRNEVFKIRINKSRFEIASSAAEIHCE
jgi:hypothetical protein